MVISVSANQSLSVSTDGEAYLRRYLLMRRQSALIFAMICGLVMLILAVAPASSQDWAGRGRAKGVVVNEAGDPIPGATVALKWEENPEAGPPPLKASKKGEYKYLGLRPGAWLVQVDAEGYVPKEDRFTVWADASVEEVRIVMREVPPEVKDAERRARINELIEQGNTLAQESKFAEAREAYERILAEADEDMKPGIYVGVASTFVQEQSDDQAIMYLERSLAIDPSHEESLRLMISILAAQGKDAEAKQYLERLPSAEILDPSAQINLGIMRYNEGDLDGAAELFGTLRASHPEIAETYYFCGLIEMAQGKNADALASFRKFVELAPEHGKAAEAKEFADYLATLSE